MTFSSYLYDRQYWLQQWLVGRFHALRRPSTPAPLPAEGPARVLVVIAGLIGDSVMCTPLLAETRRLWPRASLTLLGLRHNCELLGACPHLTSMIEAPALPFRWRQRRQMRELRQQLRNQRFEVALIALGDQFAHLLAAAGIPIRVGVRESFLAPCLTHTYEIGSGRTWGPAERLNALRVLGAHVGPAAPELWVPDAARAAAERRLADLGLAPGERFAAVHPFGSTARQWWPPERVLPLATALQTKHGLRTLLIGGPETRGRIAGNTSALMDATGAFSLAELLAVLERADLVVSTDSGPFHMAGALRRPLVGLFRKRRPEHADRYPQARVLLGQNTDCESHCRWDHCVSTPCRQLAAITVADVVDAMARALQGKPLATSS